MQISNEKNDGIESVVLDKKRLWVYRVACNDSPDTSTVADAVVSAIDDGLLYSRPPTIFALTKSGQPGAVRVYYKMEKPKTVRASFWTNAPNLDAALHYLEPQVVDDDVLLVDEALDLSCLRPKNAINDHVNNPYPELERFARKVYDGSLKYPELERFKGMRFGGVLGGPFCVDYYYDGKNIHTSQIANHLPRFMSERRINDCIFEIRGVDHLGFKEDNDFFVLAADETIFQQLFSVELEYVGFCRHPAIN